MLSPETQRPGCVEAESQGRGVVLPTRWMGWCSFLWSPEEKGTVGFFQRCELSVKSVLCFRGDRSPSGVHVEPLHNSVSLGGSVCGQLSPSWCQVQDVASGFWGKECAHLWVSSLCRQ